MMDWTDRHCRFFLRLLTRRTLLYTEMVTTGAVIHGDREHLLGFEKAEHPVAVQLGGSDPAELAEAACIAESFGYDEINLNVGCPSDRVQSGRFGACLMREPGLVADCVAAMGKAVSVPVTVKCRIGVDDQDPVETLPCFVEAMAQAGCRTVIIHARKAWLEGLSPKDNRTIPPLDYGLVHTIKSAFPDLEIILNGGVRTLDEALAHTGKVDGAMIGRGAYETPYMLARADRLIFGEPALERSRAETVRLMMEYCTRHLERGGRLHQVTRHMLGLYQGVPGARIWRRMLSVEGVMPGADESVLARALEAVEDAQSGTEQAASGPSGAVRQPAGA